MNGAQVGVLEQADHEGLCGFLEGVDGGGLESQITLVVRGDLSYESLERQFSDKELCRLLILSDLSECHGTGSESVGLLDGLLVVGRLINCLLTGGLICQCLSRSLGSSLLSRGLFCSGHFRCFIF